MLLLANCRSRWVPYARDALLTVPMPPSMPPSADEESYVNSICTELESAISCAVNSAIERRVQEPVEWVANFMLQQLAAQQRGGMDAADGAPSRAAGADDLAQERDDAREGGHSDAPPPPETSAEPGATRSASWSAAGWLASLSLHGPVLAAIAPPAGVDAFEYFRTSLTREQLEAQLRSAELAGMTETVWAAIEELRERKAATGAALSAKFAQDNEASFEMNFGSLDTFFGGLEGLIGTPTMIDASLLKAMAAEHCGKGDCDMPFNTSNGMEDVTSKEEWEFVVEPDAGKEYKERGGGFREEHREWCRRAILLSVYEEKMEEVNAMLLSKKHTPMVKEELVGGRLYTGPVRAHDGRLGRPLLIAHSLHPLPSPPADVREVQRRAPLL